MKPSSTFMVENNFDSHSFSQREKGLLINVIYQSLSLWERGNVCKFTLERNRVRIL